MSDHTPLQLLLQSLELFHHLEEDLFSEMTREDQQRVYRIKFDIEIYFQRMGWRIGYDDFRGYALCAKSSYTEKGKEERHGTPETGTTTQDL